MPSTSTEVLCSDASEKSMILYSRGFIPAPSARRPTGSAVLSGSALLSGSAVCPCGKGYGRRTPPRGQPLSRRSTAHPRTAVRCAERPTRTAEAAVEGWTA
ncbi:hypothetical protein GCM10010441_05450 [Kitasatospora paracochleata]